MPRIINLFLEHIKKSNLEYCLNDNKQILTEFLIYISLLKIDKNYKDREHFLRSVKKHVNKDYNFD